MTSPESDQEILLDAVTNMLPPVLNALEALRSAGRHLHPTHVASLAEMLTPFAEPLATGRKNFTAARWPEHLVDFRDRVLEVATTTAEAIDAFTHGARQPQDMAGMFRAMRRTTRAQEGLYPLAAMLPPVSRFFMEPEARDTAPLVDRAFGAMQPTGDADGIVTGMIHGANERDQRGGFSLYVPEYYRPDRDWPLVVALHGGSGHGRDFLFSWLREARTRGFLVLAPTSADHSWSMMGGEDIDARVIQGMVARVCANWRVDPDHRLITGMSDGATYALLCGPREGMGFTHYAPISGVMHPDNTVNGNFGRLRGAPVYLVHGSLDWMFPIESAHMHRDALLAAGADLTFREIEDLSHTYPTDENGHICDWFCPALRLPGGGQEEAVLHRGP